MATGGEIEDDEHRLVEKLEKWSIGEEESYTLQCWTDSEIEVWIKKGSILKTLKNVVPPILQFLVQRQQKALLRIAEKHGFVIHLDRSKNRLEAECVCDHKEQELDKMIEIFGQNIESVCDMYSIQTFFIEDNVWPCIEKELYEKAKSAFEESILQVYKKCEGTYCLIGLAEKFGKYESLLSSLGRQYKAIRIENKELFDALEIGKILDSRFKQVEVAVHGDLLLLHGEEEVIKEYAKHYEELSKTENMHFAIRVVSENMYKFLRGKRSKISSCLFAKGYHVYWTVKKGGGKCFLTCSSISEKPEKEIDFLTNYIVKEIELQERYLQGEQVSSKIEQMENAKLFTSESGIKTLVYYGNMELLEKAEAMEAKQRFWFYQTIASSSLLRLLDKSEVQNFINSKLQIHDARWSIEDKRKIRINCQCLAEVDRLVSLILDQVWCVSRPVEVCQNDPVKQFLKDRSNFVEIEQDEKYCTFYVTVDLKDELGRLLGAQAGGKIDEDQIHSELCDEIPTERVNMFIEPDIKIYLFKRCNAQLTKISEDLNVCISYKGTSLELKGKSKENVLHAKQVLLELLNSIVYQKDIVRIKREWDFEKLKKEIDKLEEKNSCRFMLSKKDEEPEYLKCWDAQNVRIVAAQGSLEDTMCDVLVCFLDQHLQPVGRSSKKIFMIGRWTEIEDAVKNSKELQKKNNWLPNSSKCKVYSSGETGFLKCRQLLFVSSDNLLKDIDEVWNKVLEDAIENQWRSICFPVELSLITDGFLAGFLSILAKGVSKRLKNSLEIQFCAWDTNESLRGRILDICHQCLSSGYIPIHCLADEKERMEDRKKSLHSSIEVKLEKGSFLEVAKAKKVDVIVNSANPELNLTKGLVSRIIHERGGKEIEDELRSNYKNGIEFGSIAISSGHPLGFQKIFHCALYDRWVSTGNFSLKVLKSLITKCLLNVEKDGLHTIAFPVLGTGRLGYPYIPVAKTIMECVTDFGKQHPKTCIQTVYIVVHEADIHCAQVFEDVFEDPYITSQLNIGDILSKPTISFLEYRMSDRGILLQVLPEDIDELVDAVIKFSSKDNTSGAVDLEWCRERGCYSALMSVSMEHLQNIVDQCFRMLDSKRITSARIHITDSMKDSELYTKVIKAFMRKLKQIHDNRYVNGISLRKLQFLSCKKQYEKMESSYTSDPNVFYSFYQSAIGKDSSQTWRKKTVKQQRDVLVSVCGPSSDHVERALSEFRESAAYATGNWCVRRDFKWAFVSSITNIKLNQAMEEELKKIEIKEEDSIYDLKNMKRYPSLEKGDVRPEEIRCLPDHNEENKPMPTWTMLWYVLQENKWMLLPEETCRMLTDAGHVEKVSDEQHVYNLKIFKRASKEKDGSMEEIMFVKAREDDKASGETNTSKEMQLSRRGISKTDEEKEEDLKIFEFVTGQITYPDMGNETQKIEERKKLETFGCKVMSITDCTFCIKGSFSQIARVNEMMTSNEKIDFVESQTFANLISIAMSERDYKVFCHFGNDCQWFKKIGNQLHYNENSLICEIPTDKGETVNKEIEKHYNKVKMMVSDYTEITGNKDCSISETIKDVQDEYPNVCLIVNDKDIEVISDNYENLLIVKTLLKHKMSGKKTNRTKRTFVKTESPEHSGESQSSNDDYRRPVFAENKYNKETQQLKELQVKTTEGLVIKIYAGSITHLNVDCIVNAANDRLMHGGGVALAISDAAGYQFDRESRKYVEDHGSIPVGNCCVTSAGKLSYKCVIHTVGPRWGDYSDKYQCLKDLQDSVEVTFKEADKRGMASIAIPAISSGIFAVPRDLCVQQYYKAAMSFSRNYSFKSLKEIHFVDKDESMINAIQEIFQLKEPSTSNTEKSGNLDKKNDTPAFGAENSVSSTMPPSNAFTIVDVSENLKIKIHIGNITDIVADAIVCPQDEYCRSEDVIAKDIFRDIPDEKPVSKQMKLGNIFLQRLQGDSQWKMIIHAVTPVFDKEHAKDSRQFGKILDTMIPIIMKTADKANSESISIPLLGAGIGEYNTPVQICASSFTKAVTAYKSELMFLKDIYLVLKDKEDEEMYVELFKYNYEISNRTLMNSGNSINLTNTVEEMLEGENCCICLDTPTKPKKLPKCGHIFCEECIEQSFKYKPACPNCGTIYGKVTGDQPPGFISIRKSGTRLQGFNDSSGSIVLTYMFDDGKQGAEHPDPGKVYKGFTRSGYLPHNKKGRLIAKLLNVAFSRRLVFTIGRSRTTGQEGVITWNDIHHKTRMEGGPARFGYPDPTYLDRVLEELEAKGVTEESADDPEEYKEYSRQIGY